MKELEIPFNFDKELIDRLKIKSPSGDLFHCIYFPPYWEDYKSAKYYYKHWTGKNMADNQSMSRSSYNEKIQYINKNYPGKGMLLLQQNDILIDEKLLKEEYIDNLKIRKFCVGSLKQAKVIKEICPEAEIIASITMKLDPAKISDEERNLFDYIVLWFPFNRKLDYVKTLPRNPKLILLVNCECSIFCQGTHHWLAKSEQEEDNVNCPRSKGDFYKSYENTIKINPEDLMYWDDYIDVYKLQGREYETWMIMYDVGRYSKENKYKYSAIKEDFFYTKPGIKY